MRPEGFLQTSRRFLLGSLLLGAAAGCNDDPAAPSPGDPVEESFTFDENLEGWQAAATDTLNPPIEWHVQHTTERARMGSGSVELHLENFNDAGKIWMERGFELDPGVLYQVEVSYAFGTADWGDVNLFTIIAGVHDTAPRDADELTFQGETGHDEGQDAGYVWLDQAYDFLIPAPDDGTAYVALGVWGTWETIRTYYIDEVTVRFVPAELE